MALNNRSVFDGYNPFIKSAVLVISDAVKGDKGCDVAYFSTPAGVIQDTCSVAILDFSVGGMVQNASRLSQFQCVDVWEPTIFGSRESRLYCEGTYR